MDSVDSSVQQPEEVCGTLTLENIEVHEETEDISARRSRQPTEKYITWQTDLRQRVLKSAISSWRKQASYIQKILSDSEQVAELRSGRDGLERAMKLVSAAYENLLEVCPDVSQGLLGNQYENIEQENLQIGKAVSESIRDMTSERYSVVSKHSVRSITSNVSNVSAKAEIACEAAALKTKLKYMTEIQQKQAELDKIQTLRDLETAEAKIDAIDRVEKDIKTEVDIPQVSETSAKHFVEDFVQSTVQSTLNTNMNTTLNAAATVFQPNVDAFQPRLEPHPEVMSNNQSDVNAQLFELTRCISEQITLSRLPPPEPGIFSGDPLAYPGWKSAFEILIERRGIPPAERLHYLKKYLGGSAKEAIEGYFLIATDDSFVDAKKLLEKRYGDPFLVANAFRSKLDKWPRLSPRDGMGLQKLADFLRQCNSAMESIESLSILNDEREIQKVLAKLPDWLITRWCRIVMDWKDRNRTFPPFREFMKFLDKEATIACDPTMSLQAVKGSKSEDSEKYGRFPKYNRNEEKRVRSFSTEVSKQFTSQNIATGKMNSDKKIVCILCTKHHDVDNCPQFNSKTLEERTSIVMKSGLCFGCLEQGHRAAECPERRTCRTCSRRHPTSLHGNRGNQTYKKTVTEDETKKTHTGISHFTDSGASSKCSMIVPVLVSHRANPEKEIMTYALLDTQSDTTFIQEELCDALAVEGPHVKLILSTMSSEAEPIDSRKIDGLVVRGCNANVEIGLPSAYTRAMIPANRAHIPTPDVARQWSHLRPIADELLPVQNIEMGLLIGYNCSQALIPREVVARPGNEPYGQKSDLGWGIVGVVDPNGDEADEELCDRIGHSHRTMTWHVPDVQIKKNISKKNIPNSPSVIVSVQTSIKKTVTPFEVSKMMELDFSEHENYDDRTLSQDDKKFLSKMDEGIHTTPSGHYEMPLPIRESVLKLPNNRIQANHRLSQLRKRFQRDPQFCRDYTGFMENIIKCGYAEMVTDPEPMKDSETIWYIPHHGVYNPKKPTKIRVVFDCSARYKGESLNEHLLQGPDLTNNLVGVLCRFRREPIAFICDVEQMFYQFKVNEEHRDYLRFLWWEDGNHTEEPLEYRMNVHLFGATSSPGCANFGMKRMADDFEESRGKEAADFVRRNFYVDDGLGSVETCEKAVSLVQATQSMCRDAGLRLHKFVSNSKEVLMSVPEEDRATDVKDIHLMSDNLPIERALGVQWCVTSDTFQFRITLKDQPLTRRGILSSVCSVYDPLGFLAPILLVGKQILQEMVRDQKDWDSELPDDLRYRWEKWRRELVHLENLNIPRCLKPEGASSDENFTAELHHFSDASTQGYGQVTYLRLIDSHENVHCSFVMGKSRVSPLKTLTIPRLELTAALVSVKVSCLVKRELDFDQVKEVFWTDSRIVLGYLNNESRRFHVFVANRVEQIRAHTNPDQWNYVSSEQNPADIASRGITADELIKDSKWLQGPDFLWKMDIPETERCVQGEDFPLASDDPEMKSVKSFATQTDSSEKGFDLTRFDYFSDYSRLRRAIANCLKLQRKFMTNKKPTQANHADIQVEDLQNAEHEIIRLVQKSVFSAEIKELKSADSDYRNRKRHQVSQQKKNLRRKSKLYKLDPFVDQNGILRVGGRLKKGTMNYSEKHPAILPKKDHVTNLIVRHFHGKVAHQGRGITVNALRQNGFWILGCSGVVSQEIYRCVTCRKIRRKTQEQQMSDLPEDRLGAEGPFTYCGVDCFGPWYIKDGRKIVKRYGVLFTCLSSRAIHVETVNSMTTDSFINALRRLIAIRGPVRQIRCDQGTNFVGADRELCKAMAELKDDQIHNFLLKQNCDFIKFKLNVPNASHMGGVWERQIRTVRSVLNGVLKNSGEQLDDESLRTLMYEVTAIVNSRPLTVDNLNDPTSLEPLTPNHLLMMKSKIILPPPGNFQREDLYSRKRWRRVQHLVNEFWKRWRLEYLQNLQPRQKWTKHYRDFEIGDVVMMKDDSAPRYAWKLARVVETTRDEDNHVRKVKLVFADGSNLDRPIHKLVLLVENVDW